MKKYYFLIIVALILGLVLTGCTLLSNIGQVPTSEQGGIAYLTKGGPTEDDADEYTLYADQTIDVGTVKVWNDASDLYVQYVVDVPWEMTGSHLYVGKTNPSEENIPSTPGQFPYSPGMEKSPSPSALYDDATMTYTIPLDEIYDYEFVGKGQGKGLNAVEAPGVEPCNKIYIVAQAEVFRSSEGNVLENPNAEVGSTTGWDCIGPVGASTSYVEATGTVGPRGGEYFFNMKDYSADYAEMSQELTVVGYDGASFKASGWIQTEWYPEGSDDSIIANDYGRLVVTFYDNSNDELESFTTVPIGNPVYGTGSEGYIQFGLEGIIPNGAEKAVYELNGFKVDSSIINVFYDDLSFEYWQEETAWAVDDDTPHYFGKNWATYFTYNIAGESPTIFSQGLPGTYYINKNWEFQVKTVNPECGFAYKHVLFNYTIFGIEKSDIQSFEYYDGTTWHSLLMSMSQDGENVTGYFGPWPDGFKMPVSYDVSTTFRINIAIAAKYTVVIELIDLDNDNAVLATLPTSVKLIEPETHPINPTI